MKQLFWLLLIFSFSFQHLHAQYSKVGIGGKLGYHYTKANKWDEIIDYSNSMGVTSSQPLLSSGWTAGAFFEVQVIDGIIVSPEFSYATTRSQSDGDNSTTIKLAYTDLTLNVNFYPLNLIRNSFPPRMRENFYVDVHLTRSTIKGDITNAGGSTTFPSQQKFTFGVGGGDNIYLKDRFYITPYVTLNFPVKAELASFDSLMLGSALTSDVSFDNTSSIFRTTIGIKGTYVIQPRLPICPIPDCMIHMEHRHMEFGEQVFRGNQYTKKQNPRYGDKHRGEAQKIKNKDGKKRKKSKKPKKKVVVPVIK